MRTVGGDPLPVVANEAGTLTAIADTIRLGPNGSGIQRGVERVSDATLPGATATRRYERSFTYRTTGQGIEISLECPPDTLMLCVAPPHFIGVLTQSGLDFTHALYYRTPVHYDRIDPGPPD
jgi:hypothetical protein